MDGCAWQFTLIYNQSCSLYCLLIAKKTIRPSKGLKISRNYYFFDVYIGLSRLYLLTFWVCLNKAVWEWPNEREFVLWSLILMLLEALCILIAKILIMFRRTKKILCCLLCALSSSYSPLAPAVLQLSQLIQLIRDVAKRMVAFLRGRIWMIQLTIHETSLQTI